MDSQIKQRWIEALRSGQYKQGEGCLREADKYCCLGVLTDLYIKETGKEWSKAGDSHYLSSNTYYFADSSATLPRPVQEWAGLNSYDPHVLGAPLSHWNDTGSSFEDIALFIEDGL